MLYDLKKFPQKKRTFSAEVLSSVDFKKGEKILLIALLFLIIAGVLIFFPSRFILPSRSHLTTHNPISDFKQTKTQVLKDPENSSLHLKLASIYKEANDFEKAKKEIALSLQNSQSSNDSNRLLEELETLETKPQKIGEEIRKWEELLKEKTGYRDAYFKIGILYYQFYKNQEALEAVNKALEIDPNFEPAKKLKELLSL